MKKYLVVAFLISGTIFGLSTVKAQSNNQPNEMKKNQQVYPKAFSHIGITVPNLDEAVKFYQEVMGWYVIMEPTEIIEENETAIG